MNLKRSFASVLLVYALILPTVTLAQTAVYNAPKETLDKIKDEGMNRSQVMQTLSYLSDVIGPRLTASPGMKRANEWTRDTMAKWGMANAHLEPWGPFGRGWTLKKFFAMVDGPTAFPLEAYPKAWSPGTDTLMSPPPKVAPKKGDRPAPPSPVLPNYGSPFTREVVLFNPTNEAELEQYKGKLLGKIVLMGAMKDLKPHFTPDAVRNTDKELLDLADARDPNAPRPAG
ncbi:MAG TPA: hypothetical protein VL501_09410, partial [Pyrinomonadaceae bacterium]|nr:hypothetical protein [Pyrinomonadaceae bacterium]